MSKNKTPPGRMARGLTSKTKTFILRLTPENEIKLIKQSNKIKQSKNKIINDLINQNL